MKRFFLPICALLLIACAVMGEIMCGGAGKIIFTNPEAASKISFEPSNHFSLTKDGLGWDGVAGSSMDGSFVTTAIAIGTSWRPVTNTTLTAKVANPSRKVTLANGQTSVPWTGQVFARYSPDKKHWSSWTPLKIEAQPKPGDDTVV